MIAVGSGGMLGEPKHGEGPWLGLRRHLFDPLVPAVA